mgnify:CR=1 FL=1
MGFKEQTIMWYFAWILGLGFAVLLAILNALWLENEQGRVKAFSRKPKHKAEKDLAPEEN